MTVALIYTRVSTRRQAEEGVSLAVQEQDCVRWCEEKGYEPKVFIDDGFSGRRFDRPALQEMLVALPDADALVVWKDDRLSRDVVDRGLIMRVCEQHDVRFASVTQPELGGESEHAELLGHVLASTSQFYSRLLGGRVRAAHRFNAEAGKPTSGPPYGYSGHRDDHGDVRWEIVAEQADVIHRIDGWFLDGWGYKRVTHELNRLGIPAAHGGDWWPGTVVRILDNPAYSGVLRWGKKPSRGKRRITVDDRDCVFAESGQPTIRSRETFGLIQSERKRRRKNEGRRAAITRFGGILRCGLCGAGMRAKMSGSKKRYYVCGRHADAGTCQWNTIQETKIEDLLRAEVERIVGAETEITITPRDSADGERIDTELADVDRRRQRLISAFESDVLDLDDLQDRLDVLRNRRVDLERRRKTVGESYTLPVKAITQLLQIPEADEQVRVWVRRTIESIKWNRETESFHIEWRLSDEIV